MTRTPRAFRGVAAIILVWTIGRVIVLNWPMALADVDGATTSDRAPDQTALPPRPSPSSSPDIPQATARATVTRFGTAAPVAKSEPPPLAIDPRVSSYAEPSHMAVAGSNDLSPGPWLSTGTRRFSPMRTAAGDRWSASTWLIYRNGPGGGLAPNGQLGGSQAGGRLWGTIAQISDHVAAGGNLRVSSALRGQAQGQGAIGLGFRTSGRLPLEVVAERRIAVSRGGRNAFAVYAASGATDLRLPLDFKLSGYGQAGLVGARRRDGFADGALRIEHGLGSGFRLGANGWGAIQPGISRVDVGPSLSYRTAATGTPMRLSAEWRQRVSGNARPGSGPAFTIGADF